MISLLAAIDLDGGIGKDNKIPWHLSADLKMFKRLTMGHHVLMGRRTYDSINKPLPGRINMVLTRDQDWSTPGVIVFASMNGAVKFAETQGESELFVIGGGNIFSQMLNIARRIYLTRVLTNAGCSVFFPKIDPSNWMEIKVGHHPADEKNEHPFIFYILERIVEPDP